MDFFLLGAGRTPLSKIGQIISYFLFCNLNFFVTGAVPCSVSHSVASYLHEWIRWRASNREFATNHMNLCKNSLKNEWNEKLSCVEQPTSRNVCRRKRCRVVHGLNYCVHRKERRSARRCVYKCQEYILRRATEDNWKLKSLFFRLANVFVVPEREEFSIYILFLSRCNKKMEGEIVRTSAAPHATSSPRKNESPNARLRS